MGLPIAGAIVASGVRCRHQPQESRSARPKTDGVIPRAGARSLQPAPPPSLSARSLQPAPPVPSAADVAWPAVRQYRSERPAWVTVTQSIRAARPVVAWPAGTWPLCAGGRRVGYAGGRRSAATSTPLGTCCRPCGNDARCCSGSAGARSIKWEGGEGGAGRKAVRAGSGGLDQLARRRLQHMPMPRCFP